MAPITLTDAGSGHRNATTNLWRKGLLCDVDVSVEGKIFKAHRLVLAEESDYMRALFSEDRFADSSTTTITLREMSAVYFEKVLELMYTCRSTVDEEDFLGILEVASRLQCDRLLARMEDATIQRMGPGNCLAAWDMGERMALPLLTKTAASVAINKYEEVAGTDDFILLPLERLLWLISSDNLCVPKEEDVYKSVIRWAKGQKETPSSDVLGEMFSHVRFSLMSDEFIKEHVETEGLLLSNNKGLLSFGHSFMEAHNGKRRPRHHDAVKWEDMSSKDEKSWQDIKFGICSRIKDDIHLLRGLWMKKRQG